MKQVSGNKIKVIGIMSGTSLDGLDIAAVEFEFINQTWNFELFETTTIKYSDSWKIKLQKAPTLSGEKLVFLDHDFGKLIAAEINIFLKHHSFQPDIIASHGHTVFHQPEKGVTLQIGNGNDIAVNTGIRTIADFRSLDVALGGQGAPLVPVGDQLLFANFDSCLNLGGFSNISFDKNNKRLAFDICPANIILNYFAEKQGFQFDKNGHLGRQGKIDTELLEALNNLEYYKQAPPKSLGKEWLESDFLPLLDSFNTTDSDKIRTLYEHISIQIGKIGKAGKMLVTGGGALNSFLIERIKHYAAPELFLPSQVLIEYKEALIFAFLGVLKNRGEVNCFSSVTGAKKDSSSGIIFDN